MAPEMSELLPFNITPRILSRIRSTRSIPTKLFNKEGQTVILPLEGVSEEEIYRLMVFAGNGLYYHPADQELLGINEKDEIPVYDGVTRTRLLNLRMAEVLSTASLNFLTELKDTNLTEQTSGKARERLDALYQEFAAQADVMTGVVNLIEVLGAKALVSAAQIMVKRTVVAMAMKTRGMAKQNSQEPFAASANVNNLMMSSMLCDVGYVRMKNLNSPSLTTEELQYVRTHPLVSYLLIAPDDSLDPQVKTKVLTHHRPLPEGPANNNYPAIPWLKEKLISLVEQHQSEESRRNLISDVEHQLSQIEKSTIHSEDQPILAIASDFASLTTETSWREAYSPLDAIRLMVNNSFFSHPDRVMRDFLDNVSVSLCKNEKALKERDFVILSSQSAEGKTHWEAGQITAASRWQSRPGVDRLATILPLIAKEPKLQLLGFDVDHFTADPRTIHVELSQDPSRRIVFAIDPVRDGKLYESMDNLVRTRRRGTPVHA